MRPNRLWVRDVLRVPHITKLAKPVSRRIRDPRHCYTMRVNRLYSPSSCDWLCTYQSSLGSHAALRVCLTASNHLAKGTRTRRACSREAYSIKDAILQYYVCCLLLHECVLVGVQVSRMVLRDYSKQRIISLHWHGYKVSAIVERLVLEDGY